MNDHDRRESGRLMLITPRAGVLCGPARPAAPALPAARHNVYVAIEAGNSRITEDRSRRSRARSR